MTTTVLIAANTVFAAAVATTLAFVVRTAASQPGARTR
jgi:hypothetical protein